MSHQGLDILLPAATMLGLLATAAGVNVTLSLGVDSAQPSDGILLPGRHVLVVGVSNHGEPSGEGVLEVELSRLHMGLVWQTSVGARIPAPGIARELNLSFELQDTGLYSIVARVRVGSLEIARAQLELEVSTTTDRYQGWRDKLMLANKTHLFLAFYYPWYSSPEGPSGSWRHWEPAAEYAATHVPLIGFYDSLSTQVIEYHIRTAQSVGLDGFICSWWGPDNYIDDAFPRILDAGQAAGFNSTIYLEAVQDSADLYRQLNYVLTRYGAHPAFLRYDGKPVIFIYSRVIGSLPLAEFSRVFSELDAEGLPAFYLADSLDPKYLDVFDGLHTYSPLNVMDRYPDLVSTCTNRGKVFAATIAPGYDDTIIRRPGLVVDRANGSYYMGAWEMVMVSKPQWVLLTSWNEWHEGSEIEPSLEFGDLYLNLTALYYGLFESEKLTPRLEERMREISGMFAEAERLIREADSKGIDTRFMKRDYSVASDYWNRFDYGVARMYLDRILARKDEIGEGFLIATVWVLLCLGPAASLRRARRWACKGTLHRSEARSNLQTRYPARPQKHVSGCATGMLLSPPRCLSLGFPTDVLHRFATAHKVAFGAPADLINHAHNAA